MTAVGGFLYTWLVDIYLLSTVLIVLGLAGLRCLRQPAQRIAVARSTVVGLAMLVALEPIPPWPRMSPIGFPSAVPSAGQSDNVTSRLIPTEMTRAIERSEGEPSAPQIATQPPVPVVASDLPAKQTHPGGGLVSWRAMFLVAFASGAALNLAWLALGALAARRLRHSAKVADGRLQRLFVRVSGDRHPAARVCLSDSLPVAVGVIRPEIVIPVIFAETQPVDRLEAALAHEWAHIRNGDLRWLAMLRLLNVLLFAQPFFWWLRHMIRADQEALADAAAAALHGDGRVSYAETLVGWARLSHRPHPGALASAALALWERPSMLQRRVRLLLDRDHRVEPTTSRRWKLATAYLGLLATLPLSMITLRPTAIAQEMKMPGAAKNEAGAASQQPAVTGDHFEYAGRVLDPKGKPIAGANLHLAYFGYNGQAPPAIRATTDADGHFRFVVRKQDFADTRDDAPWSTVQLVAAAEGFGLGWADASREEDGKVDPQNLTIRLAQGDLPISGRLVDLEGRPVVGAIVRPQEILEPVQGDLSAWITVSTSGSGGSFEIERAHLKRKLLPRASGLPIAITTDSDGRFAIRGVGRERLIRLNVSGPTIQTKAIGVLTRDTAPFQVNHGRGSSDWGIALYYGNRFTHATAPTKLAIGVVKDLETGKPLGGVRIAVDRTAEFPVHGFNGIEMTSDEHGRYRLTGLPKGRGNQFIAIPAKGQPYLAARVEVPDTPGLDPVALDIGLKRGIVIEGRVVDETTGERLKAYVAYYAYEDNPYVSEAPGFRNARVWGQYQTEPDGSFRIVGLPGHGLVAAMYTGGGKQYLTGIGLKNVVSNLDQLPVVPDSMMGHFNALTEVDLPKEATTVHCDLALQSGVTRTIRVVDPEGRPMAGARIRFHPTVSNLSEPQRAAEFQVEALRPDETRPLIAFHDGLKLAGAVDVHADHEGITELRLLPSATLVGRLVDEEGGPRAKVDILNGERHDNPAVTDSQGRFRVEALVPGKPARVWVSPMSGYLSGTIAKALVLKPGEIKDLGEVREDKQ
jgi:beta-lactamase regulating signal transducer with metallopeptidase domain